MFMFRGGARLGRSRAWTTAPLMGVALALGMLFFPAIASAHAYYVSSNPKAGAVVKTAPTTVSVTFAENVDPKGSDIVVYDASHTQVSTDRATVSTSDLKTMTVPMKGTGDGVYFVEWHTVSADDGDPDIGGFNFTVGSSDEATPGSGSSPNTTATAKNAAGVPVWIAVLIGVVGLVVGAGGAYLATRRSK